MSQYYKHTQIGYVTLASSALISLIMVGWMLILGPHIISTAVLIIMIIVSILFGSLTVELSHQVLHWYFGIGLLKFNVPLRDVDQTQRVRNSWLYGWGIHYTPYGWLYNASGFEAIQFHLKNGRTFRLGTDEPEVLQQAIEDQLPA